MKAVRIFIILSAALILFIACDKQESKSKNEYHYQTINEIDTLHTKVIYANEFARVVRLDLHSQESIPMHNTEPRLVYILNDYQITLHENGKDTVLQRKQGEIHWHGSQAHSWTNTGDNIASCLIISRTDKMLPDYAASNLEHDVAHVENVNSQLLFENDYVRTVKVTLPVGGEIPTHEGINRLMIALNNFDIELTTADNVSLPLSLTTEEARWFLQGEHSIKNIGETEAEYLIISFKK